MTENDMMVAVPWLVFCVGLLVLCVLLYRSGRSSRRRSEQDPPRSDGPDRPDEPGSPAEFVSTEPLQQRKLDGSTTS